MVCLKVVLIQEKYFDVWHENVINGFEWYFSSYF